MKTKPKTEFLIQFLYKNNLPDGSFWWVDYRFDQKLRTLKEAKNIIKGLSEQLQKRSRIIKRTIIEEIIKI